MKTLIMIPAHNEAENIERTVDNIRMHYPEYDYVVINDGSKDNTADICRKNGYTLLDLPVNLGLTGAFQTGMRYANRCEYDAAIQIDGDGQHDPKYIAEMLEVMQREQCDIVIGSRFCEKKKPHTLRMLGSALISFAIRLTTRAKITDPTSGMRLYNKKMIAQFAHDMNYSPEPDTVSYLIRTGCKVKEVQVEMYERIAGTSYLNLSRSISYMLNQTVSILFVQLFRLKG